MTWTVIVKDVTTGECSHSFSFIGSHDSDVAFEEARSRLRPAFDVIAIVKGDHPVYSPVFSA